MIMRYTISVIDWSLYLRKHSYKFFKWRASQAKIIHDIE